MRRIFAQSIPAALLVGTLIFSPQPATAAGVDGFINGVFADPSDFVFTLDKVGPCGSAFFHVKRTNQNFKEMTAVMLTAFAAGKRVIAQQASCAGDRNVVSHGWSYN